MIYSAQAVTDRTACAAKHGPDVCHLLMAGSMSNCSPSIRVKLPRVPLWEEVHFRTNAVGRTAATWQVACLHRRDEGDMKSEDISSHELIKKDPGHYAFAHGVLFSAVRSVYAE